MKVFLVEDAPLVRQALRRTVEELGGEVAGEASEQDEALRGIGETGPDVVVLDLRLRVGNGVEVLRALKTEQPQLCVLVLTNCAQSQYRMRCMALGADYFFDKATDFQLFAYALTVLAGRGNNNTERLGGM